MQQRRTPQNFGRRRSFVTGLARAGRRPWRPALRPMQQDASSQFHPREMGGWLVSSPVRVAMS